METEIKEENGDSKVDIINGRLDLFMVQGTALDHIAAEPRLEVDNKFVLYSMIKRVRKSPEVETYIALKNELINTYGKDTEAGKTMPTNHPELFKLLNKASGLIVERIKISKKEVSIITTKDMIDMDWLIDFEVGSEE